MKKDVVVRCNLADDPRCPHKTCPHKKKHPSWSGMCSVWTAGCNDINGNTVTPRTRCVRVKP